jgi:hypothetical protein
MLKSILSTAIALCAISATANAFNEWNVNATSCTADAGSIQGNLYIGTGGTVKFANGRTGDIILYCPVPQLAFTPSILGFTFYDDSTAAGNHVTVQLIKMDMQFGRITSVVTLDSKPGPATKNGQATGRIKEFTDNYDPTNFAYYIRVDIVRNSATANEIVYGIILQE